MSENTLKCYRCGQNHLVTDMRYTAANKMVCKHCLSKTNPKKTFSQEQNESKTASMERSVEYVCSKCNYKFKRKAEPPVNACPYCGRQGTLELQSSKGAASLIEESLDKKYDF